MRKQLIYDIPTRVLHWILAGFFVTAFLIANTIDDESPAFSYHMLAGLLLGFTVLLRIIWGFVGTTHARFTSFALHPGDLIAYFSGILSGDKRKWAGHNPASSWAAIMMFGLALSLGATGYLMSTGQKETFEDVHELLANAFLAVVLMHIAGVVLHSLRHRDKIGLAMMDGKKSDVLPAETISKSRPLVALLFVVLIGSFAAHLANNFDGQNQTLNLFGTTLQLGEQEGDNGAEQADEDNENDD